MLTLTVLQYLHIIHSSYHLKKHKNWLAFLGGYDGELYQPSLNQAAMMQCKFKLEPQINTSTNLPMRHSPLPPPEWAQLNSH